MTAAPLRLGIDGRELRAGVRTGIRRYVVEVLRGALDAGWEVSVYGDRSTSIDGVAPPAALVPLRAPATPWWDQVSLPQALARDRIDVLLSPYYKAPLRAPCPVVITIHDLYFIDYPGPRRPVHEALALGAARLYARAAAAIVTDSEHSRRAIVRRLRVPADAVRVVPVAVGDEFHPTALAPATRARYGLGGSYVLYLGNFKPHKNVPALLCAWAALPAGVRAAHRLVLGGGDDARPLRAVAEALGIGDGIAWPGRIADDDLPAVYSGAQALVLPSLEEGFGLPALEAMACGRPVIASNRGALPETAGPATVVVDPAPATLAAALTDVLGSRERREELSRRGLAHAAGFSRDRTAGQVLDVLARVASRPGFGVAPDTAETACGSAGVERGLTGDSRWGAAR